MCRRCVGLAVGQLDFYQRVVEQSLPPQRIGGIVPVCMEGFAFVSVLLTSVHLFHARMPQSPVTLFLNEIIMS